MADQSRQYKVVIVAPTCFYYQTPLFRTLAADDRLDLTVYFCSDEGLSGKDVKTAYGADKNWGVEYELLDGYRSKFLKNYSPWGSYLKSLVGLANFGIWRELSRERPDAVIVMSWMNPTWWLVFLACARFNIPVLFMTDANVSAEHLKSVWKSWIKKLLLGKILFPITAGFLCAGTANRSFFAYYGVPARKLVAFAYSWGYDDLVQESDSLKDQKMKLRSDYGLPLDSFMILYCGRLSPEKGTVELIEAYEMVSHPNKALVLVGDGGLRQSIQDYASRHRLKSVYFMGFRDRKEIGKFYTMADLLVLPSQQETWGIVVSEALSFSLPVIVSDQVGAGIDLVLPNQNGHVFPAGDVGAMADCISDVMNLSESEILKMGATSGKLIREWLGRDLGKPLGEYLDTICQPD